MTQQICQSRQAERGFTLVELAIVMIIIGLLIGGILKGQELIANARVTSQVSQVKGIDAAMTTFRDQYASLPGDMLTPATRLPNCAAAICNTAGNGDGFVQGTATANDPGVAGAAAEGGQSFVHLAAASLLGGVNPSATAYNATAVPAATSGSGILTFGYSNGTFTGKLATAAAGAGHYLVLRANPTATSAATPAMLPKTLGNIDRKLDDGNPNTGSVLATGAAAGAAACADLGTAAGVYNEALGTSVCNFAVKIQQ